MSSCVVITKVDQQFTAYFYTQFSVTYFLTSNECSIFFCVCSVGSILAYLLFIQWYDHCAVVKLGLAYHCLGELHLCCDIGHGYRVVVIIGDVQSALSGKREKV